MKFSNVDPNSPIGRVYKKLYTEMAVNTKAVIGDYLVPVPGLPSGIVGTSTINSLLMKEVVI